MAQVDGRTDVGTAAVDQIYKLWRVDEAWSLRDSRSFTWWGGDFRQRVQVDSGQEENGLLVYQLSAETDFICRVDSRAPDIAERLGLFNRFASSYAIVLDPPTGRVGLRSSVVLHEQNAKWIVPYFSTLAIIQPVDAQIKAAAFVEMLGGRIDSSSHPLSGVRAVHDDMLNIIQAVYRPKGAEPSRWLGAAEFEQFLSMTHQYGLFSTGDATGLSAELSFGDDTALITANADQRHPQLGHGLLLLLKLPVTFWKPGADHLAVELNTAEANTFAGSHLLGGWCSQEISGDRQLPVFAGFVPNAAYRPGLVPTLVMSLAQKARWARSQIAPYAADTGLPFLLRGERRPGAC
jgi:hypothetical protein